MNKIKNLLMLRTLTYSFILFLCWALFARWYYACYIKGNCCDDIGMESRYGNLRLSKDGAEDILRGYDQFSFNMNAEDATLSENNTIFMKKVAEFMNNNPQEKLVVRCCARTSETAALGERRAVLLKNILLRLGVNTNQVKLASCIDNDALLTPALFSLQRDENKDNVVKKDGTVEVENTIFNMNISDENFEFNSAIFQPNSGFINQVKELKTYAATHPNISLEVIGHTDNVGSDGYNMQLGQRRADAVKAYFINQGIKVKIATSSQGEQSPIASNDTDAGRAQNRRVNSKLIQ